ncbi:MAG: alkaline phosphatase [Planctomycetota bacterium]|nr:alkaline phosphatase [Planctomycetota bacterium]
MTKRIRCPGSRRTFLAETALGCGALVLGRQGFAAGIADEKERRPVLKIGLLTDLHYAEKATAGSRHYRDSLRKIRPAVDHFNKVKADFAVELGDFVDEAPTLEEEFSYLGKIEAAFARFKGDRHYVLGNHCVSRLKKGEFLSSCGQRRKEKRAYYSFDRGGFHFVVLDACFRSDGVPYGRKNFKWTDTEIPPAERKWLAADLQKSSLPTIVFAHQRLDVGGSYGVKSAVKVRKILEDSSRVLAVFQGHNHVNDHKLIGGVHYVTLAALIEGAAAKGNNAWSVLEVYPGGVLKLDGFHHQEDYSLAAD